MVDTATAYKKMAGTAAVFLRADYAGASPVERDGLIWAPQELHLEAWPAALKRCPPLANVLALEGLEDYDPPADGDQRHVASLAVDFVYLQRLRGWVQFP